jgi:hyperosmotically inducible protein
MNHAGHEFPQKTQPAPFLRLATATLLTLALVACSPKEEPPTLGQKLDAAISKTEKAAEEAREKTEDAVDAARERVGQAVEDVKTSAAETGAVLSEKAGDAAITAAVSARLAGDPDLSALRIDVDTRDGKVTLSGPAPTEAARARAAELATSVKGVLGIDNKVVVTPG